MHVKQPKMAAITSTFLSCYNYLANFSINIVMLGLCAF